MIETTYHLPGVPPIALLGDFHNGEAEPILHSLEQHHPSVICIAGDVVYAKAPESGLIVAEQRHVLPLLRGCVAIAPTFMSLGNHESILCPEDMALIRGTEVTVLDNTYTTTDDGLVIAGLTSHYILDRRAFRAAHPSIEPYPRYQHDPEWQPIQEPDTDWLNELPDGYSILLSHHPEYYPLIPKNINLVLAAHAHGGQVRFYNPFRRQWQGLYAPGQGWFPRYTSGKHGRMIITRGLTNTARVPRINNPTEIVYISPAG